jgi:hypothetical protein
VADSRQFPPLKSLHTERSLNAAKLAQFERIQTDVLLASLVPGHAGALKTRPDGTILDGHHRVLILRGRGVDVDGLPREIVEKEQDAKDVDGTPLA